MIRIQLQFVVAAYVASDPSLMPKVEIVKRNSLDADKQIGEQTEEQPAVNEQFKNNVNQKNKMLIEALSGEYAEIVLKESDIGTLIPQLLKLSGWIVLKKNSHYEDTKLLYLIFNQLFYLISLKDSNLEFLYSFKNEEMKLDFSSLIIEGI